MNAVRTALALLLVGLPVAACQDQEPSAAPAASVVPSIGPSPSAAAGSRPPTAAAQPAGLVVEFGVLEEGGYDGPGLGIAYDKVDYRPGSCDAQGGQGTERELFEACWSNVNPRLRSAALKEPDERQALSAYFPADGQDRPSDEDQAFSSDEIDIILAEEGRRDNAVSVWRIVLDKGVVVELTELPNVPLTPTQAAEAERAG